MAMRPASAVRKALTEENSTEAMLHLPENTHDLYNKALSIGTAPVFWDALMPALHYKLRTTSIEELKEIAEVTEGLENRILHSIDSCYSFEEMMDFSKQSATHARKFSVSCFIFFWISRNPRFRISSICRKCPMCVYWAFRRIIPIFSQI